MGAGVPIYVKVLVTHEEWWRVTALDLEAAKRWSEGRPEVVKALEAHYDVPKEAKVIHELW